MNKNKGANRAIKLLAEIGFDEITEIPMDIFVSALGATLIEEALTNCDGKIIRGKKKTLIKINSNIPYEGRKRFTIAHEIGHYLLHERLEVHNENSNTLNWFKSTENQAKQGIQEKEANDFATELLMPTQIFQDDAYGIRFSPELLKQLSDRFKTSITSTLFRYSDLKNLHPIFIVFVYNGIVKYWKKSQDLYVRVKDIIKLKPPLDSVAQEYIDEDYEFIYTGADKVQQIDKSTWFDLNQYEEDSVFYEYCIPIKQYKTLISVVWEK